MNAKISQRKTPRLTRAISPPRALARAKKWRSQDGCAVVWNSGASPRPYRIQATDPKRIDALTRLSRVEMISYAVVGGPLVVFALDGEKLRGKTVAGILADEVEDDRNDVRKVAS